MLPVDLYTRDIPAVFERFGEVIGVNHWSRRVAAIKSEIKGQPYLRKYLLEENAIAVALERWSASRRSGASDINDRSLYPAFQVAAHALAIMDRSSPEKRKQLIRRIHGGFRNPDDMRALRLEFGVATHFVRRGYAISWPEMQRSGTFDIMVHGIGAAGLEVECKSASVDKGRRIHKRDAIVFNHLIRDQLDGIARRVSSGLAVVLTVPERLPTKFRDRQTLVDQVRRAVLAGKSADLEDGGNVRLAEFDVTHYPSLSPTQSHQLRADIDAITGTRNREAMVLGQRDAGALVFVAQSRQDDTLLRYIFNSVGEAARKQLSTVRAGIVLVGLEGISTDELVETAQQDKDLPREPTALRMAVSKFLNGASTDHVVGIGFLSKEELTSKEPGHVSTDGSAYHFPKTESKFWHDDFRGMFASRG